MSDQDRLLEFLEKANKTVRSWPEWKQTVLGAMPAPQSSSGDGQTLQCPALSTTKASSRTQQTRM